APFSRALVGLHHQIYSGVGADIVMESIAPTTIANRSGLNVPRGFFAPSAQIPSDTTGSADAHRQSCAALQGHTQHDSAGIPCSVMRGWLRATWNVCQPSGCRSLPGAQFLRCAILDQEGFVARQTGALS